jgi:hypothetical protein
MAYGNADAYVARQPDRLLRGHDVSMCMLLLFMRMLMFVLVPRSALPGV